MIAGMEWDFGWSEAQLNRFIECWNENLSEKEIAKEMRRRYEEVIVLILDLKKQQKLPQRELIDLTSTGRSIVNVEVLRTLFVHSNITMDEISRSLGANKKSLEMVVQRERKKNPEKWPLRKLSGGGRGVKSQKEG